MKWFKKLFKTKKIKKNKKKAKTQKAPVIVYGAHSSKGYRTREEAEAASKQRSEANRQSRLKDKYNLGYHYGRAGVAVGPIKDKLFGKSYNFEEYASFDKGVDDGLAQRKIDQKNGVRYYAGLTPHM